MRLANLVCVVLVASVGAVGTADAARFNGVQIPLNGEGYLVPPNWAERGLQWGVPDLIGLIQRAAAKVHEQDEDATLFVGDISLETGEATRWHKSHRTGHDADLIFYALDENGDPAPMPDHMTAYGANGHALDPSVPLVFDSARNWLLVKALVEDPEVRVTHIFIANVIKRRLLEYASGLGESQDVIDRAAHLMGQPSDSAPHNDHMHVRIGNGQPIFDEEAGSGDEHELVAARQGVDRNHGKHARHVGRTHKHKAKAKAKPTKSKAKTAPKTEQTPAPQPATTSSASAAG
jgi:murein endopeptidase